MKGLARFIAASNVESGMKKPMSATSTMKHILSESSINNVGSNSSLYLCFKKSKFLVNIFHSGIILCIINIFVDILFKILFFHV